MPSPRCARLVSSTKADRSRDASDDIDTLHAGALRQGGLFLKRAFATVDSSHETHDDFKPKSKQEPAKGDIEGVIKTDITSNEVFVYMKGTPDAPSCGFSNMACRCGIESAMQAQTLLVAIQ